MQTQNQAQFFSIVTAPQTTAALVRPVDISGASSDAQLVDLWLRGRSRHTQRAYGADIGRFLTFTGKPLAQDSVLDLQTFADSLTSSPASRSRTLSAVKSLLTYGQRTGYLTFNVGAAVKLPAQKQALASRILSEADVQSILVLEKNPRNKLLLRLLYAAGLRVSELCGLTVRDLQARDDAGQVTVFGKGSKTRAVLLPASVWKQLAALVEGAELDAPVFRSRKGSGPLTPMQVFRIVRAAARRAGLTANVSPHWLRHAHASHALDRGAPAHLVQQTLGHSSLAVTSVYAHARPSDSSARYLVV